MDALKLENQLCFPLYAASRTVVKLYAPLLEGLGLTYTQYITMLVMWERKSLSVGQLGEYLYLDSGTLTPLLKKLERQGLISRRRSETDERRLIVELTAQGEHLRERAEEIPMRMYGCVNLAPEEAGELYQLLYKILDNDR